MGHVHPRKHFQKLSFALLFLALIQKKVIFFQHASEKLTINQEVKGYILQPRDLVFLLVSFTSPQLFCRLLKPAPHNPQMTSTPLRTTYIVNTILICILHGQGTSEKEHKEKQQKQNTIKQLKLTNNIYMKNTKSNLIIKIQELV